VSRPRALFSWSSGKDSAWALHTLRQAGEVEVVGLLTTMNAEFDRVAMHAVRRALLEAQAEAAGLPLVTIPLPWPCSNEQYEAAMARGLAEAREGLDFTAVAFGDLFLEDVRAYREQRMEGTGLTPLFPLWGRPTPRLAREMVAGGLRAVLTCVDPRHLPLAFAGRTFDAALLDDLPDAVDPCGERGEFHTFAYAGPMFSRPVERELGEVVERDGFVFADVLCPAASGRMGEWENGGGRGGGESVFDTDGALTREFLLNRGYCCGNGCRNCPYPAQVSSPTSQVPGPESRIPGQNVEGAA